MRRRQALPVTWLMTDERMGDALFAAIARMPRGSGVVVRHYGLELAERRALFALVQRAARRRGLLVLRGGSVRLGAREDGVHGGPRPRAGLWTMPAHDRAQAVRAARRGVDALFVSPVFATRSHPDARTLGVKGIRAIIRGLGCPAIALGGMDAVRARRIMRLHAVHGWAGIDAWL